MPGLQFSARVGAYDRISKQGTLSALADRAELAVVLPFAAMFYGSPSTYLYYDAQGTAHEILTLPQHVVRKPVAEAALEHNPEAPEPALEPSAKPKAGNPTLLLLARKKTNPPRPFPSQFLKSMGGGIGSFRPVELSGLTLSR